MALFFAIIVIYDAAGVRMETGREAKVLNLLRRRDLEEGEKACLRPGSPGEDGAHGAGDSGWNCHWRGLRRRRLQRDFLRGGGAMIIQTGMRTDIRLSIRPGF